MKDDRQVRVLTCFFAATIICAPAGCSPPGPCGEHVIDSPHGSIPAGAKAYDKDCTVYLAELEPLGEGKVGVFDEATGDTLQQYDTSTDDVNPIKGLAWDIHHDPLRWAVSFHGGQSHGVHVYQYGSKYPVGHVAVPSGVYYHQMSFSSASADSMLLAGNDVATLPIDPLPNPDDFVAVAAQAPPWKGVCLTSWQRDELLAVDTQFSLNQLLAGTAANTVAVVATWYVSDVTGSEVYPTERSPSTEALESALQEAQRRGFELMLKPHVDVVDGTFRGDIWPDDPSAFFASYRAYINTMADLAARHDCSLMAIGTEMKKLAAAPEHRDRWVGLIRQLRGRYSGPLVYCANWDNYRNVTFWQALDYIGIDAYFPLSSTPEPSVSEITTGWDQWLPDIRTECETYNKSCIFTEIGYTRAPNAAAEPWRNVSGDDGETQARCYRAAIDAMNASKFIVGGFIWNWEPSAVLHPNSWQNFTPQGGPAADVLADW